jgi:hypothetical protein
MFPVAASLAHAYSRYAACAPGQRGGAHPGRAGGGSEVDLELLFPGRQRPRAYRSALVCGHPRRRR